MNTLYEKPLKLVRRSLIVSNNNRIETIRKKLLGEEFETNSCGKCVVVDYKGEADVTVKFHDPEYTTICRIGNLKKGNVNNPLYPSVYRKGYIGVGKYSTKDVKVYKTWCSLMLRSYDKKFHLSRPTYKDVTVCEEWHNFQNFAGWCYSQKFFSFVEKNGRSYHLDKDILVKGNKVYSPETCCFVPNEINVLLITTRPKKEKYPKGISYLKKCGKFNARLSVGGSMIYLGLFKNLEEAFGAYKEAKEIYIKQVATKWRGSIDDRVYNSLLSWNVSLND